MPKVLLQQRQNSEVKKYQALWDNISNQEETSPDFTRQEFTSSLERIREQGQHLARKIDVLQAVTQDNKMLNIGEALEQDKFEHDQYVENFSSRNVIKKLKSDSH